jgi:hypothetical protein
MATDPNGGSPWAHGDILTPASANILRANDLIQLDTAGGTRTMSGKLIVSGTDVFEVSDKYLVTSRAVVSYHPIILGYYDPTNWSNAGPAGALNTATTTSGAVNLPMFLPQAQVITEIAVMYKAAAGHGGAPAVMPTLKFISTVQSTGTNTQIGATTTDTYGSAGAYETRRLIRVTGLSHTVDNVLNTYSIQFTSEGGANAISAAAVTGLQYTATITSIHAGF